MIEREKFLTGEKNSSAKLCPNCNQPTLQFNQKTGKIHCSNCGFEEMIPLFKK